MDATKLKLLNEDHSQDMEEFERFETKIDEVVNILKMMNSDNETDQVNAQHRVDKFLGADREYQSKLKMDDFIVSIKEDRTVINKTASVDEDDDSTDGSSMGKRAFMSSVERDAARRAKERKEREANAQNLRKLGNQAFHKEEYEKAINMYNKALDQIKDNYVVYNNRALTYIRLGLFHRAIIDCDFVIQKLDDKNTRSWLYRAYAYWLLGEMRDFDKSMNEARKNNPKDLDFIEQVDRFIRNVKADGGDELGIGAPMPSNIMTIELEAP